MFHDAMGSLLQVAITNAALATVLALAAFALARWTRNPPLVHFAWLVVLVKLLTPPILPVAIPAPLPGLLAGAGRPAPEPPPDPAGRPEADPGPDAPSMDVLVLEAPLAEEAEDARPAIEVRPEPAASPAAPIPAGAGRPVWLTAA